MLVIPGESIGKLRFRSSKESVAAQLGPEYSRHDYGDGRESWNFPGDLAVLFKDGIGLVAVTLDRGPLVLWDKDLFALSDRELCEWLDDRQIATSVDRDVWGDKVIRAAAIGLFAYYAQDDPIPSIEFFVGSWSLGKLVHSEDGV